MTARAHLAAASLALLLGCSRSAPDATPDGAVRLFLERMELAAEDPRAMREAYDLLGPTARKDLEERAARASFVQGKRVEPHTMLAAGRFGLRFRPKKMVSRIEADGAAVSITGSDPAERAEVRCVREGPSWRIEPELPPMVQLPQRRMDAGGY